MNERFEQLVAYIVDDEEVELFLAQRILKIKRLAGEIRVFRNGADLIKALTGSELQPHFVLLNFRMRRETGIEILESLQNNPDYNPKVRPFFIVTSSTSDLDDLSRIDNSPDVDAFIWKPIIPDKLKEILHRLIP